MAAAWPASGGNYAGQAVDNACNNAATEAALRSKETALLGARHADEHAQARARKCRVAAGQDIVAQPDARTLASVAGQSPATVGQWSAPIAVPVVGVTAVLLHTGKVLFWSYDPASYYVVSQSNRGVAYLWDPVTLAGQSIAPPENIWCGGQTIRADGRVYVAGGNLRYPDPNAPAGTTGWEGALTSYTFNPANNRWTAQPNMTVGRWYPTATQLVDNRVVITSGYDETGSNTLTTKVSLFTPSANPDGVGTMGEITPHNPSGFYPFQFVMPDAQMLQAGPASGNSFLLRPDTWSWDRYPSMLASHWGYGNAISYTDASGSTLRQTVMVAGGTLGSGTISDNEYLDGANPAAGWRKFPNWLNARRNGHTVILADGTLLTMGGNASGSNLYDQPVFQAELYARPPTDPTGSWVAVAPHSVQAAYHSSGILLPDGRVLLTSDDMGPAADNRVQVYSPPYLFKGERPRITNAPANLSRGQAFTLATDSGNIAAVMLVAPGATTHANDMHQRAIRLRQTGKGSSLNVTLPAQPGVVPPGYYMLFAVNGKGVPSLARFVRVI
jgi:hypothetical protein